MNRRVILDRNIVSDPWHLVAAGEAVPARGDAILPLSTWLAAGAGANVRDGRTGVWLAPDDEPAKLAADLAGLPLVAVHFPQFTDGRGYSTARLLRQRHGFKGELRAFGDVLRDQLFYLERVGFNAFDLKEGKSVEDALLAFGDFSDAYQSSVERPLPHYRRRPAGADA